MRLRILCTALAQCCTAAVSKRIGLHVCMEGADLKNKSKAMSPSEVKMGKAAKTAVSCPICRYVTKIVFRADHRGRLQFIV